MIKRNVESLVASLLLCMCILGAQSALAACSHEEVKLWIFNRGLVLTPASGPKCLHVADLANVNTSFTINLATYGGVTLADGDVGVTQVSNKTAGCGSNLTLGGDLSNTGANPMTVTVTGTNVSNQETVCFDIGVKDIGTLDPRARIVRQSITDFQYDKANEVVELAEAYYRLTDSALGASLHGQSLDQFLQAAFGMTEEEARRTVAQNK